MQATMILTLTVIIEEKEEYEGSLFVSLHMGIFVPGKYECGKELLFFFEKHHHSSFNTIIRELFILNVLTESI